MSGIEKKWYVIKTISGQEHKVKAYIENEIARMHMVDYLGQVVVPVEKVFQLRNGKKVSKEKVYYPGYVFTEMALIGEMVHFIKNLPGVISFLSETKGGDPIPLREVEVRRMLGKVDELMEHVENTTLTFFVGESVKVIDGPFNGFNGNVERVVDEKRKLEVMVLIFGRKTPIELNFMQVEKI